MTGEVRAIRENGAASGAGVLATYSYDDLGRRIGIARGNGTSTSVTPDAVSRLAGLTQDLAGTAGDLTLGFGYTAASQIAGATRSNDAYGWRGGYNRNEATSIDGLNRATAVGGVAIGHDARGNVTGIGAKSYSYSAENLLLAGPNGATLGYDPLTRLYETRQSATTRFGYDGADMIAEYDASNVLQRRYVHGPGTDEPLVWYEGSGTNDRRWLHADERGSIIALSDGTGASIATNRYDEYGVPALGNSGRFQYTGQAWLPDLGLYYYKARMYAPDLGRFLQTDPIGYSDGMNLYGYVGGDPVNASYPSGLCGETNNPCPLPPVTVGSEVVVTANRNSGGVNIIGTIVGAAKLVNKGLCAIGIKFFGGCKKKKAAPTAAPTPAPTAAPEPQSGIPAGAGAKSFSEAEKIARRIASEELARTQKLTLAYRLGGHNDLYDAERYSRWVYRMAIAIGSGWAGMFATGHEFQEVLGQPFIEMRMDLSNNALGLQAAVNGSGIPNMSTPGLVYIYNGQLVGGR